MERKAEPHEPTQFPPPDTYVVSHDRAGPRGWAAKVQLGHMTYKQAVEACELHRAKVEAETIAMVIKWLNLATPATMNKSEIKAALGRGEWKPHA